MAFSTWSAVISWLSDPGAPPETAAQLPLRLGGHLPPDLVSVWEGAFTGAGFSVVTAGSITTLGLPGSSPSASHLYSAFFSWQVQPSADPDVQREMQVVVGTFLPDSFAGLWHTALTDAGFSVAMDGGTCVVGLPPAP